MVCLNFLLPRYYCLSSFHSALISLLLTPFYSLAFSSLSFSPLFSSSFLFFLFPLSSSLLSSLSLPRRLLSLFFRALAFLMEYPDIQEKVREEIWNLVGKTQPVQMDQVVQLEWLDAVLRETLRMRPVAPLAIPHHSNADETIQGYHIPKQVRVVRLLFAPP